MKNHYLQKLLGENEIINLSTHQHWFVLFSSILAEIIIILVVLAGVTAVWQIWFKSPLAVIAYTLVLFPIISMIHDILLWTNQDYIVTNLRVIQLSGIINKNVIDSSLDKVNDVKLTQSFWGRLFDFGDVEILTASELGVNVFKRIGNPIQFKTSMLNAKEKLEGHVRFEAEISQDIPAMIEKLDKLRQQGILSDNEFQSKKTELLNKI